MIEMLNCDCMDYMASLPDKAFELAIVDPPYGGGQDLNFRTEKSYENKKPDNKYFQELFRVSRNQVIWGGNYFDGLFPCRGFVFWHKHQPIDRFSDGELAWTSFDSVAQCFDYPYTNVMEGDGGRKEKSIHPTQKPVALYKWLLSRYAKPGDRIIDTHGGSGSIAIACHDLGYDLTWMEIDADYYKAACERYALHASQGQLFEPKPETARLQASLFNA